MGRGQGRAQAREKGWQGRGINFFGVEMKAKKLGVIVSINKGAQNSGKLPAIFEEIFKLFPDSPVFLTNGGGMRDWEVVESDTIKKLRRIIRKKKLVSLTTNSWAKISRGLK